MNALPLLEAKRDGQELSQSEISSIITACVAGDIPDYQMAALLMAIYFRGLSGAETRALTFAMRDSGERLAFAPDPARPVVDKHSTGGVGDKVSLPLAPLLACLGFRVPMISGRSLGITGGTLDKLESIPGFRTRLSAAEVVAQVDAIGCVICGQTERMCPADRLLYSLRDATGTVPSIPLITASILSKKLAEGIEALVLDVKAGCAAFASTPTQAEELARAMTTICGEAGVKVRAMITDMNSPLGRTAGNWLEVREAVECLEGGGPPDLRELVIDSAAHLLVLTRKETNLDAARIRSAEMLSSGAPRQKWDEMLAAQGADLHAFMADAQRDRVAPVVVELRAVRGGYISAVNARTIGEVVRDLGGGRMTKESTVDPVVGLDRIAARGSEVRTGDVLCRVHGRSPAEVDEAMHRLQPAFPLEDAPPAAVTTRVLQVL